MCASYRLMFKNVFLSSCSLGSIFVRGNISNNNNNDNYNNVDINNNTMYKLKMIKRANNQTKFPFIPIICSVCPIFHTTFEAFINQFE